MANDLEQTPSTLSDSGAASGAAGTEPTPPGPGGQETLDAAADGEDRALRDVKSQHGRELAQERKRAEQAERVAVALSSKLEQLQTQVTAMGGYLSQRDARERDAYLNSLPPDKRTAAEVDLLKRELSVLRGRNQGSPQPTQAEIDAYTEQTSRKILDDTNRAYGLSGDLALTGEEDELDWDDEKGFVASVKTLAKVRSKGTSVPKQNGNQAVDLQKLKEDIRREVIADLGVGRSNSAKAAGGRAAPPSSADFDKVNAGYSSKRGMAGHLKNLKATVEKAREAAKPELDRMRQQS